MDVDERRWTLGALTIIISILYRMYPIQSENVLTTDLHDGNAHPLPPPRKAKGGAGARIKGFNDGLFHITKNEARILDICPGLSHSFCPPKSLYRF